MEVVFVLYDVIKKTCLELLSRVLPAAKDASHFLLISISQTFELIFKDLLSDYYFPVDWRYLCSLVIETILVNWIVIIVMIMSLVYKCRKTRVVNMEIKENITLQHQKIKKYSHEGICNLIKNCDKPSLVDHVLSVLKQTEIDLNLKLTNSKSGLTPFLCACISGSKELVEYMLKHGADINYRSSYQDSPLHIATFACASQSNKDDFRVLTTLLDAGCKINSKNWIGNTPLCIAASYDKGRLIRFLISQGADPSICNNDGIYPIDFASNAGNQHLTSLLRFKVSDSHVWEFIEPHTPPRIKLGLQTPCKKHLADSSFIPSSKRKLNTFRTPHPGRTFLKQTYRKSKYKVDLC